MNPLLLPLLWLGLIAAIVMTAVWALQWRTRNARQCGARLRLVCAG